MRAILSCLFGLASMVPASGHAATELTLSSGKSQVTLIELYTSQGCSSCPPADRWLSELNDHQDLWRKVVPVAFHVDYWDYIGWRDHYAEPRFGHRQRDYRRQGSTRSVYTPGFFVNGQEWRGFFRGTRLPRGAGARGVLEVDLADSILTANYDEHANQSLSLHVAVLGVGISTRVNAGENARRTLKEDFVVLHHMEQAGSNGRWTVNLPEKLAHEAPRYALAVWVSRSGRLGPLQATGGWLPPAYFGGDG